jgi:hypothetical protein
VISRQELTDQRIAGRLEGRRAVGNGARAIGQHLNNWNMFGSKSIFDFAELVKDMIPIDPVRAPGRLVRCWRGSSYKGHGVDALAPRADEGRGRLR